MNINSPAYPGSNDFGDRKPQGSGPTSIERESTTGMASTSATSASSLESLNADKTIGRVAEGAHHTIDRVADSAKEAGHVLQEKAVHLRDVGTEMTQNLRGRVRDNPIMSLAVAAFVGMIVGKLRR